MTPSTPASGWMDRARRAVCATDVVNASTGHALAATAYFCALSVAFTWPATQHLHEWYLGDAWDGANFLWTLWSGPYTAFELGQNPLRTQLIYAPDGASLAFHSHALLPSLLSWPLQRLFGLLPAYNLMVLSTIVLSGLGAWCLTLELTRHRAAAYVAGSIFALSHFRVSGLPYFNLAQNHWLALFMWGLIVAYRRRSLRWSAITAAFALCTLYSSYNLFVFEIVAAGCFVITALVAERSDPQARRTLARHWAWIAGLILVGALPLLLEARAEIAAEGYYARTPDRADSLRAVPLERWVRRGPLHGKPVGDSFWHLWDASFLGYAAMYLGAVGVWKHRRRGETWAWVVGSAVFFVLAMGPWLNWDTPTNDTIRVDTANKLMLPYHYLRRVPVFGDIAEGHRWGVGGMLGLTVLSGYGAQAVCTAAARAARPALLSLLVTLGLLACVAWDYGRWPFPLLYKPPPTPEAIGEIARDPRDVTVLQFPGGRHGDPSFPILQTAHTKPVFLVGSTARRAPSIHLAQQRSPLWRLLHRADQGQTITDAMLDTPALRGEIHRGRIGWAVLSWERWEYRKKPGLVTRSRDVVRRTARVDRLLRRLFPQHERRHAVPVKTIERWRTLGKRKRDEQSRIYRVYRVPTPWQGPATSATGAPE